MRVIASTERWIIEGDFIIVLNGIFGTVPERTAYRIPSDVNKIVEMDNAYEPNTALGIGAPNIIDHPV